MGYDMLRSGLGLAICGLCVWTASAGAAVMTNPQFGPVVDEQYSLVGFDVNGVTYQPPQIATVDAAPGSTYHNRGGQGGSRVGEPASTVAALNDAYITTGVFNPGIVDFELPSVLTAGGDEVIYLTDFSTGDPMTLTPLDGGGAPIGSWTLAVAASDFGEVLPSGTFTWNGTSQPQPISAFVFTLADFVGDPGVLTDVAGIRVDGGEPGLDPGQVGVAIPVPEPASLMLLAIGGAVMLRRR